ncbi:RNA polymerase factor sigma-54 [Rickettsiales endosymbiont of Stachyamoeba lipophora]|uniref:RNA polymerase factor sigma-54 n=1 Tax=Rickettsiales endosymbiont of Stachyamoeba lipophora TaxID=2486578 RepID=UPI000F64B4DA|nr:RNA polymerase factor sigma-54 [Rickettsiales endosymbiont of Stachyamoeba lipophora]AZL15332.1 RNA polymerase sigma-54 factor [Rickettsiales endosymbiont of Stachyamoeba lipophora]
MKLQQLGHQSQQIALTHTMQQSLHVLSLNNLELAEYLKQVVNDNPLLIEDDVEDESKDEVFYNVSSRGSSNNNYEYNFENFVAKAKTLNEHISEQIYLAFADKAEREIAFNFLDQLDDNGWLKVSAVEEVIKITKYTKNQIALVLNQLKQFDPSGIFAENLAECLKIQLKEKNKFNSIYAGLLDNLALIAKSDLAKIQKIIQLPIDDIKNHIEEIKKLNPRPANLYSNDNNSIIGPDIIMKKNMKGEWILELNNQFLPKLLVDRKYYSIIKQNSLNPNDYELMTNYFHNANSLIQALDQRANTILKVATVVVSHQLDFFGLGVGYLKPLSLSKLAEVVGLHESTVSRVCQNKFILTPLGLLPLKYFFSKNIVMPNQDLSNKAVMNLIKNIIEQEEIHILSDDEIVGSLRARGIEIARRTVAKYRSVMNIPSSNIRKRQKQFL